ncbi:MAG: ATP-binding protein, partial [Myxococcota bacterium]|nr:ATP-binding protein [Myxococcota bacterium]
MKRIAARGPNGGGTCPIVAIGASAGGLESFAQLLSAVPCDTGMAFVLVQHLDRSHSSLLADALSRTTAMSVREIRNGIHLEPNHVYVVPPSGQIGVKAGVLSRLSPSRQLGKPHMPIDVFFGALAADRGRRAIGVVLSGTGSDGTAGLMAIKAAEGVTLAQDPSTARFGGMPESAVAAGVVDMCLSIPQLAEEIARLARDADLMSDRPSQEAAKDDEAVNQILVLVRNAAGVDYRAYEETTIKRRLARRIAMHRVDSVAGYLALLESDPAEVLALCDDLLIPVTSFFRAPDAFESLKEHVFPALIKSKAPGSPIRIWVAGCSTGEETYSLAIALLECCERAGEVRTIQMFGSDISERAISRARAGLYNDGDVANVSPERRCRFFARTQHGFRISKQVRERCIFVRHDIARDPPFSKLDLVSCRNLLTYFNSALQKQVLSSIHYALNPGGYLVLGGMESVSAQPQLFEVVDGTNKIFSRVLAVTPIHVPPSSEVRVIRAPFRLCREGEDRNVLPGVDVSRRVDALILARYSPCGAVVNDKLEVVQFRGHTGPYLEAAPGHPQLNILKMAREGLLGDLRTALSQARKSKTTIRREAVRVRQRHGVTRTCNVVVAPLPGAPASDETLFLVLFEEPLRVQESAGVKAPRRAGGVLPKRRDEDDAGDDRPLADELKATREYLQSLTEEHEETNDALSSANKELMSSSEELQSMNEELETEKEELQSANEELTTLNDELQNGNQELGQTNNDLVNVLSSVEIPIVILDADRRIRRFTPGVHDLLNLLPVDVGRPIDEIRANVAIEALDRQIAEVIETLTLKEFEVQDRARRWYRLQIRPYRTLENRIDGVVMSFVDIDPLKRAVADAEWARDYASSLVEAVQVPLVVLDPSFVVISANRAFYDTFDERKADTEGRSLFVLGSGQWDMPDTRSALADTLAQGTRLRNMELTTDFPRLGKKTVSLSARVVGSGEPRILLAIEDITQRAQAEVERIALLHQTSCAKDDAIRANKAKDLFLASLSHDLRTPLSSLLLQAQLLGHGGIDAQKTRRIAEQMERGVKMQAKLIDDLLDVSRIASGNLKINLGTVDLEAAIQAAVEMAVPAAERKGAEVRTFIEKSVGQVVGDPVRLQQIFLNLLTNAIKFTGKGGRVTITSALDPDGKHVRVAFTDTGIGIKQESLSRIFDRFTQLETPLHGPNGGVGLGLAIVRHLVDAHGGTVEAESPGEGKGATFTVLLPAVHAEGRIAPPEESSASLPLAGRSARAKRPE